MRSDGTGNRGGKLQEKFEATSLLLGDMATILQERIEATSPLGEDSRLSASSPQEFNSGARIFVGGEEAAMAAMGHSGTERNPAGINFCVDCRYDMGSGRGGTSESFGLCRDGARRA